MIGRVLYIFWKILKKISRHFKKVSAEFERQNHLKNLKIDESSVKFGKDVRISGYDNIKFGKNIHIGSGCFIKAEGGLEIQDNVIISRNVVIYTNSHQYQGKLLPFDDEFIKSPVIIKKNVWIGMNVTISPGTTIGEGAIIGLGSRIYGDVPDLAIVGSQKPKIIKFRNSEHYHKLKENRLFCKEDGLPLNDE